VKLASLGISMLYLRFLHAVFLGFNVFLAEFLRGFVISIFSFYVWSKKVVDFNFLKVEKLNDFWRLDLVIL